MLERIVELRKAGYTWNQVDQMILPADKLKFVKGKIYSQTFQIAKKAGLTGIWGKDCKGAHAGMWPNFFKPRGFKMGAPVAVQTPAQVEMFI